MKQLPITIKKGVFIYNQKKRCDVYAIYEQLYQDNVIGHEVFKINKYAEREIAGVKIEAHEAIAGDNQFGVTAWSTGKDYSDALAKFDLLTSKEATSC